MSVRVFVGLLAMVTATGVLAARPPREIRTGSNTSTASSQMVESAGNAATSERDVQPTDHALAIGRDMARCEVSRHPEKIDAALRLSDLDEFNRAARKLYDSLADCMVYGTQNVADVSRFEFAPSALAGLFAEAALTRSGMPALTAGKYDPNAPKLDWLATSDASLVRLRLAECLAQTQPGAAAALVGSAPDSAQELSAFQSLVPAIPACLDRNVTLKATRSSLRLVLAYALYRRTIQPAGAAAQ